MKAQNKYKKYRNLISARLKQSKQSYFTIFFEENIKELRNTRRGIKNIILVKHSNQTSPNAILSIINNLIVY